MTVSSCPGSQLVQCNLTVKSLHLIKAANRCRSLVSVCTLMRMIPLSVPRVKMVDVGNPWLGRFGCCAIYWWWAGEMNSSRWYDLGRQVGYGWRPFCLILYNNLLMFPGEYDVDSEGFGLETGCGWQ